VFLDSDDLPLDAKGLALRIRTLIGGEGGGDCASVARRLGVSEASLAAAIALDAPRPSLAVLTAIVRSYGVDPAWLFTGQYDLAIHRKAMDDDSLRVDEILRQLLKQGRARSTTRSEHQADVTLSIDVIEDSRPPSTPPETTPAV
jgi:transcriptional regulator with XRE-family HTH domain